LHSRCGEYSAAPYPQNSRKEAHPQHLLHLGSKLDSKLGGKM
jgi:hypothetical protein